MWCHIITKYITCLTITQTLSHITCYYIYIDMFIYIYFEYIYTHTNTHIQSSQALENSYSFYTDCIPYNLGTRKSNQSHKVVHTDQISFLRCFSIFIWENRKFHRNQELPDSKKVHVQDHFDKVRLKSNGETKNILLSDFSNGHLDNLSRITKRYQCWERNILEK